MPKIATCRWFEREAEAAAEFYSSLVPESRMNRVWAAPADYPAGKAGDPIMVEFRLAGEAMQDLNGGVRMAENSSAASVVVETENQAETDRLWAALLADGGNIAALEAPAG